MSRIVKRHCDSCGKFYEGRGQKYCSPKCQHLGVSKKFKKDIPPKGYREEVKEGKLSVDEAHILTELKKQPQSPGQLSRIIDRSKESVIQLLDDLREKGYELTLDKERSQAVLERVQPKTFDPLPIEPFYKNHMRIGVVSDTHLGSKYQQLTLLQTAYREFEEAKVEAVLHAGDMVDGDNMYRGHANEIFIHGADPQADYVIEHYPTYKKPTGGMGKTFIIGGNHDDIYRKRAGHNVLRTVCSTRDDIEWRGTPDGYFDVRDLHVGMLHPVGGPGYARTYQIQRKFEGVVDEILSIIKDVEGLRQLPKLFFFGHYHLEGELRQFGTRIYSLPCLQARTPYLRSKGLVPNIGYLILEVHWDRDKIITKITPHSCDRDAYVKEKDY